MVTAETAAEIWNAYREINAGEKLLEDMEKEKDRDYLRADPASENLRDAFGRKRQLELGVPSGENGHRLFSVDPSLAKAIIRDHIGRKRALLVTLNEKAGVESRTGDL